MKGNPLRKRYILLFSGNSDFTRERCRAIEKATATRLKFVEGKYAIFLSDQFRKNEACSTISHEFSGVSVVTVSGTIRKCKRIMKDHTVNGMEKLPDNLDLPGRE